MTHKTGDQMVAAQFIRFVATGAVTSVVQFGVFLLLFHLGDQLANLAGIVLSSMLANEMHRRLTFRAHGQVTWLAAQWQGGGLSAAVLAATSTAMMLLGDVISEAWWARVLLIAAVNAIAGSIRFALLRWWVSPPTRLRPTQLVVVRHPTAALSSPAPGPPGAVRCG